MISFSSRYTKKMSGIFVFVLALSLTQLLVNGEFLGQGVVEAKNNQEAIVSGKIRATIEVQNRYTDILMRISGVVGTGTGIGSDGQPVIKVLTMKTGISGIPENIEGIPVDVEVTGMIVAFSDPTTRFDRPVPIGVSTGHPNITAGTIGCRVIDSNGNVYALSNNHVYAISNDARIGDAVIQPGTYDGGSSPGDDIGTLFDFEPLDFKGGDNTIDAAIALSSSGNLNSDTPSDGYGTPSSTIHSAYGDPVVIGDEAEALGSLLGQSVQKFGRTTGLTKGTITGVNFTVNVCYACAGPLCFKCKKLAKFVDQIIIVDGTFSAGGDSGSLIVTDDVNKNPVGLLFAGSSDYTIANRIDLVLNRFGVAVDDGSSPTNDNIPPTADFSFTSSGLTVDFTDTSSDSDGSVVARSWDFGDGSNTSSSQNPSHTYAANGTYTATLTVTDNDDATGSTSQDVSVSDGSGGCSDDADGDGHVSEACGGDDCDDGNKHIYPGHNDTKGRWGRDGVDNDCNGIIDG